MSARQCATAIERGAAVARDHWLPAAAMSLAWVKWASEIPAAASLLTHCLTGLP